MTCYFDFAQESPGAIDEAHYHLSSRLIEEPFMQRLTPIQRDVLDIAMAAYTADRRSRRDRRRTTSTGQREIHVKMKVREPDTWNNTEVTIELRQLFEWLSGDRWIIELIPGERLRAGDPQQHYLFAGRPKAPVAVSLFSGGLDSLAGSATLLAGNEFCSHVLVSAYTNSRLRSQQSRQFGLIKESLCDVPEEYRTDLEHVAVPMGINKYQGKDPEKSQRMRALVYLTIGIVTAIQAGSDTLYVHENGVGALNLPLNETQLGVDKYRGVHPHSLLMVQKLYSRVFEQQFRLKNLFQFATKAEMCTALPSARLLKAVRESVSCDKFPLRISGKPQCGVCTSCILRRHAIESAGLQEHDPVSSYRYDILGSRDGVPVDDRFPMQVMRGQANRIRAAIESDDAWVELVRLYPDLYVHTQEIAELKCISVDSSREQTLDLYRRYCIEWDNLTHTL